MKINEMNNNASLQINNNSLGKIGRKRSGFSLSLYVNGQSEQVTVKIIDNKSKETIREITSHESQDISSQIYDIAGRLYNEKA
ncbi:MAG: flagellar protein FlaG [Nitrospirae bacterium]|nr:flagellar protein FlaG [Nitrospirota bacterium]